MEYLSSPQPDVLPKPIVIPQPETIPVIEPDEDDPFRVPGPKVNPTPKAKKKLDQKKEKKNLSF